ncbi:MAG: hypothetical protein FWD62_15770 [Betaproteobacteria bacterium]|nr:hypothetical protein [Betaproteobacteria bacterium]
MQLTTLLHTIIAALLFVVMYALSSAVDLIYKIDDAGLKTSHLRSRIVFLESVANESLKNCNMSATDFENFVRAHYGKEIHWIERGNEASIGMLKITKKDSCIEKINFGWMF